MFEHFDELKIIMEDEINKNNLFKHRKKIDACVKNITAQIIESPFLVTDDIHFKFGADRLYNEIVVEKEFAKVKAYDKYERYLPVQ